MSNDKTNPDLAGKVVVLTGGGGILGSRFTQALAARGARVAVVDCDESKVSAVVDTVNKQHPETARGFPVDITDKAQLESLHGTRAIGPEEYRRRAEVARRAVDETELDSVRPSQGERPPAPMPRTPSPGRSLPAVPVGDQTGFILA